MAQKYNLESLLKWAQRDEWREMFEDVLDQHLGTACYEKDVEIEDLPELLDKADFGNLWGCAFEDMIATEIDGRNIADDYLKRRGWKESAGTRTYIRELRQSVMSLYEVSGIRREEGFFIRDLVRGGDPFWVHEKLATRCVAQWDRLAVRVVTVNGRAQLGGGLLLFNQAMGDEIIAELNEVAKASPEELAEKLAWLADEAGEEIDDELGEIISALKTSKIEMTIDETLANSAFMFTTYWLREKLDRKLTPPPELFNQDGDPYEPTEVLYPLAAGATPQKVRKALARIPALRKENDDFWNWVEENDTRKKPKELPKAGQVLFSQMEDRSHVLGTLDLDEDSLLLSVNSFARATRGRELFEPVLGRLVLEPEIERRTAEDIVRDAEDDWDDEEEIEEGDLAAIMPPERLQEIKRQYFDDHYAHTLDRPIPALGDISPRLAARTADGREKAVGWVKAVENNHARRALADPTFQYDCGWIWDELGLAAYRN